ncbi:alpha/beta hydrolase [Streptomyces sp. NPDC051940]|uniref:alpha/beta fold hydrolase n=1 Tax=Streptomyces sp. NPDC051940 TaxID=3155675 RepID=UPI00342AD8B1
MSTITEHRAVLPGGLTLPYAETGQPGGTPVVLVHGYADSWWTFEPVLRHLPASVHAYAPTQRGHGDADKPQGGYLPEDFADDLAAFLDAAGIERAVLVGGSSGGIAARILAGRAPHRVAGLVLLGVPAALAGKPGVLEIWDRVNKLDDPVDPAFAEEFNRGLTAEPVPPGFLRTVTEESLKAPARVWRETMRGLLDTDLRATLYGILVPTLVIWGDRDRIVPRSDQQTIVDAIFGAELLVYEGVGHVPYWERPEWVARDLTEFVGRFG